MDNETTETAYDEKRWTEYIKLCEEYREDSSFPSLKDLQNEEIVTKDGFAKSGFVMFGDGYEGEDSLICCRLWRGKEKIGTVLDHGRYKGSFPRVFQESISFIERNTKVGWKKTSSGGRQEVRSFPKEAIREALVNAIAHRDYSIAGTQIDVDIYCDRLEIVSPGSWLLPKSYAEYPLGSIPSIRRNTIIAAIFDEANLMERGGTGFQTMIDSYRDCDEHLQPVVSIYPGFLNLRLYDRLYEEAGAVDKLSSDSRDQVMRMLDKEGPKLVRDLQAVTKYKSRSQFLAEVLNPLMEEGIIYRDGNPKSPTALIKIKQ